MQNNDCGVSPNKSLTSLLPAGYIIWIILLVVSLLLVLTIGIVGGSMGWKLASLTQKLKTFPTEKLSTFNFHTGDLLLFSSGMQKWASSLDAVHMLITDCPITHVGMVVINPDNGLLRCWELALGGDCADLLRLTNLYARVQSYRGTVLVRKLKKIDGERLSSKRTYNEIRNILKDHHENPKMYRALFYLNTYDSRTSEFLFLHPPLPIEKTKSHDLEKEWICTDLISETYLRMGVFDSVDLSLWPRDFFSNKQKIPITANWSFSEEIRLEKDIQIS